MSSTAGRRSIRKKAGTAQVVVTRSGPPINVRVAKVRPIKIQKPQGPKGNLSARPVSLSNLKEISLSYGVALGRLAKR